MFYGTHNFTIQLAMQQKSIQYRYVRAISVGSRRLSQQHWVQTLPPLRRGKMTYYYIAVACLMAVEAVLFWKLGYSRGMLEAMQEQTKQEQVKFWSRMFTEDNDEE